MGALLVCALAVPTAFGDGGVAFGLGYLVVVIMHSALYSQAQGRRARRPSRGGRRPPVPTPSRGRPSRISSAGSEPRTSWNGTGCC
ncbi:hypothetical protein ACFVX6_01790 [Streptomyces sp. NPDC058289]|uniref:hypothetical protein n=1 Tax=Streptomyces sp. NPDC058289 TaxID=3346425 RepID=UPI0036EEABBF